MAVIRTFDEMIDRISDGFSRHETIWGETPSSSNGVASGSSTSISIMKNGYTKIIPTLETGVTAYIPTTLHAAERLNQRMFLVGKIINFGSLDISGASGTFTDGSAMPTQTVFNTSYTLASPIFVEVTTALNATPGVVSITYTDQDGNTGQTTAASQTLGASAPIGSGGVISLASGDTGVRDITAAVRTGGTTPTGVVRFWGIVPICLAKGRGLNAPTEMEDLITGGFTWTRLVAGDEVGLFKVLDLSAGTMFGGINYVGDK